MAVNHVSLILHKAIEKAREDFSSFVRLAAPLVLPENFVEGRHIYKIAERLGKMQSQEGQRIMIELPPGSMKSKIASVLYPAWCFGVRPSMPVLQISHTAELAGKFGREVRNLLQTDEYREIFPKTKLSQDSQAAYRWETTDGGVYFAGGAENPVAGWRGRLIILDDVLSEQTAFSAVTRTRINDNYPVGIRSRLLKGGNVLLINTRWHVDDLSGRQLKLAASNPKADQWERIRIPAVLDAPAAQFLGLPEGGSYWPEMFSMDDLEATKASNTPAHWESLYMQNPVAEGGNIFKETTFKKWTSKDPPPIDSIVFSIDTAYGLKEQNDFSVCSVWGTFTPAKERTQVILLGGFQARMTYEEFVREVYRLNKVYRPQAIVIENKSRGQDLLLEMQREGLPVIPYTPSRATGDKIARAWSITPLFEASRVWFPTHQKFAQEAMAQLMLFPNTANDDIVDTVSQALIWMRSSGILDTDRDFRPRITGGSSGGYWNFDRNTG